MPGRRLAAIVLGLLLVLYPFLVYTGLQQFGPRVLAALLLLVALAKLTATKFARQPLGNGGWLLLAATLAGGVTLLTGSVMGLKFYPVIVSLVLLAVFGVSLFRPPSMIERFARLQTPDLPTHAIAYTRKVTWVWCGFFILNGAIACLSVFASDKIWALYNGLISYVLIGLLLAGEYWIRLRVQRKHAREEQLLEPKLARND
jgi:uncharacterized membrane protein